MQVGYSIGGHIYIMVTGLLGFAAFILIGYSVNAFTKQRTERKEREESEAAIMRFRKEATDEIEVLVKAHVRALYIKKLQGTKNDAYGNVFDDVWIKEKVYFYDFVVAPHLKQKFTSHRYDSYEASSTSAIIEAAISDFTHGNSSQNFDIDSLTPYEFEAYCAELLNQSGWSARATAGSGDQGIDIIGEKDGLRAVFQVKKYSSPVGNKAVQEVIAGKAFASADLAFVVSNASFTPSAVALANVSGVKLLHFNELEGLVI